MCHGHDDELLWIILFFFRPGEGAADVRSTIRIVESQKEKCDELRHQYHVLQERVQYLTQLRETLLTRLNQLIEAHAQSNSTGSNRPTPRDQECETAHMASVEEVDQQQMDCNEALGSLASVIVKICTQVIKKYRRTDWFHLLSSLMLCWLLWWLFYPFFLCMEPTWMQSLGYLTIYEFDCFFLYIFPLSLLLLNPPVYFIVFFL